MSTAIPEQQSMLTAMFNHATEGIILCDFQGLIQMVNPAALRQFGYPERGELVGQAIEVLIPESLRKKHIANRQNFDHSGTARPMGLGVDLYGRRKDGGLFPVEISLTPLEYLGERYTVAFIVDTTSRKQIEDSVKEKQKELESVASALIRANEELEKKVEARTKVLKEAIDELEKSRNDLSTALEKEKDLNDLKSRFISMASHEFRTPLTTILSSASLIDDYQLETHHEKRTKHVRRIKSAVNNLNDILSDFLSISKLEEGKVQAVYRSFDFAALLDEVTGDLQLTCKPGQRIESKHQGSAMIILDPQIVKNILINLTSNAIKFSPPDSIISIRSETRKAVLFLEIKDQGIGISPEDQKHLFERFYRGKNAFNIQGTGLGLHIVSNYIGLLNGQLSLESELNRGTCIRIELPLKH